MFESFNELLNNSRSLLVQNEDINDKIKGINERLESIEAMLASLKTKAPQQEDLFSQGEQCNESKPHKTRKKRDTSTFSLCYFSKKYGLDYNEVKALCNKINIEIISGKILKAHKEDKPLLERFFGIQQKIK